MLNRLGVITPLLLLGLIAVALPNSANGQASDAVVTMTMTNAAVSAGFRPFAQLPDDAQPWRGVLSGSHLKVLAHLPKDGNLVLFDVDTGTGAISATPLGVANGGDWIGLDVGADGSSWIGVRDSLIHVVGGKVPVSFRVPAPQRLLPAGFGLGGSPLGLPAIESGQISSVAVQGDRVLLGRVGAPEITRFDQLSATFSSMPMPSGLGDVKEFIHAPGGSIDFTVNHSAVNAGSLFDAVGSVTPAGVIAAHARPAVSLASNGHRIVAAGQQLSLDAPDFSGSAAMLNGVDATTLDRRRVALRSDDSVVVRTQEGNTLLVLAPDGTRLRSAQYQVPLFKGASGALRPYASWLVFAQVAENDDVWFSIAGRPDIYRLVR